MDEGSRYIQILRESLEKKERLLNNIIYITNQQEECIKDTDFDMDIFEDLMGVKDELLDELIAVDDGFQSVYERIRDYLNSHQMEEKDNIKEMQNRIREITRLSVSLQALEERNRQKLEVIFVAKQKNIREFRKSSEHVNNYFNMMNGNVGLQSAYFNKKK